MKNIITSLVIFASMGAGSLANAQVPYAAPSPSFQVSTYEMRLESDVQAVMAMNDNCDRTCALGHIRHALDSQKGIVGYSKEIPREYSPTYNPAYNAFQQNGQGFYAGVNMADGRHVFTMEQRHQVLEGSYTYCPLTQRYTFLGDTSACK